MCYISNQDICLLSDNKVHGMKRRHTWILFLGASSFLFLMIGGVERGADAGPEQRTRTDQRYRSI